MTVIIDSRGPGHRNRWVDRPLVGFDTETTGVRIGADRIVTACAARTGPLGVGEVREWIANPGMAIPPEATRIHGVTDDVVALRGRPHDEVAAEVAAELYACWAQGYVVAVYCGRFDFGMVAAAVPGFEICGPVVDGFVVERRIGRGVRGSGRRSLKLTEACDRHGVRHDNPHNATADAVATIHLVRAQAQRFPWLAGLSTSELMLAQQHWHRRSLRRSTAAADGADGHWLIPSVAAAADIDEGIAAAASTMPSQHTIGHRVLGELDTGADTTAPVRRDEPFIGLSTPSLAV
ncbi:exonuclease domain-containing protein (plasmid) [Nocardia sp. CA-084685]|uniref:exonuclease domain-containing protein n=1 Tax=Nocardia sp. CA-084685 TaxID=3239970 RepID=UPI003D954B81